MDACVRQPDEGPIQVPPLLIDYMHTESEHNVLEHLPWRETSETGWIRIKTAMDSGASESVAPPKMAPGLVIEESPGSRRVQQYISASKERLPIMGQQTMRVTTNEG